MSVDKPEPNLKNVEIPQDFLTKVHIGRCAHNFTGGCTTAGGLLSDFNIWSRALSEEEANDWTSCKTMDKGDIVNWETGNIITHSSSTAYLYIVFLPS